MNMEFAEFANFSDSDRVSNAPLMSVKLRAPSTLTLTMPFNLYVTLCYHPSPDKASEILIQWRPYRSMASNVPLVILEKTEQGLEEVENEEQEIDSTWKDETVGPLSSTFVHLSPDNPVFTWNDPLPGRRYKSLMLGKEYVAFWPGGEVKWWDWRRLADHEGRTIKATETVQQLRPAIILPASNTIQFTVGEEPVAWPGRAEMERRMPSADFIDLINFAESRWRHELNRPRGPILD